MTTQNNNKLDNLSPEKRALVEKLLAKKKQQKLAQRQASKIAIPDKMRTKGRLSFSQQRLWLLDQLEGGSAHYNIPSALHIHGKLDLEALKSAFLQIIERHRVLRTRYVKKDDEAQQVVMSMPVEFCFEVIDSKQKLAEVIQECGIEAAISAVRAELELRTEYVFDLERDTALRCHLWQLDEDNSILLILVHHIAADGWSMGVLTEELNQLYRQAAMGGGDTLKPIDVQYLDYAQWQHEYLTGEVLERQLTYWQQQLSDMPSMHNLPLDSARPRLPSYQGDTVTTNVPMNLASSFKALCNDYDATLFMGVYGVLSALLSRYSGEQDIVIGTTAANRDQTQVENLIGFFVNMLVLRQQHDDSASFIDLLTQSKRIALDAFNHQQTPFEKVVERINPTRDIRYHPLFQIMLAVQNNQSSDLQLDGLSFSDVEINSNNAKFDLSLNVEENESGLCLSWEYSTDLFHRASIENLANSFTLLLEAMAENPERSAFSVPLVDSKTRETELYAHNQTKQDYPREKSVADLFEAQALLTPDAPAATFNGETLSYRELDKRANALAHELQSRGIGRDDLVGVHLHRSMSMLVSLLAVLKSGGAYVPLDPNYPKERIQGMLSHSQPSLVLCDKDSEQVMTSYTEAVLVVEHHQWANVESEPIARRDATSRDLAYVIYTSGSTGEPKGIAVEHQSVVNFLWSMAKQPGLRAEDTLLAVTSMSFDIHVLELYLPLVMGGHVVVASSDDALNPSQLAGLLSEQQVSVMQATPSTWQMLVNDNWQPAQPLRAICGGEAMPESLKSSLLSHDAIELWNVYGPTETTVWSSVKRIEKASAITLGHPIGNTQLYVLNEQHQLVPTGVAGELYIAGEGLARGYLHRDDLTDAAFVANPFVFGERMYKTGDRVRRLAEGELEYLGRTDHQVKLRGFRVELGAVDAAAQSHESVNQVVSVVYQGNGSGESQLVTYVVLNSEWVERIDEARSSLYEHLKGQLPHYMVPSIIQVLEAMPLTPNGKINRKGLPEPTSLCMGVSYQAPQGEVEARLCQLWSEVLKLDASTISREANFFEVGGQSLKAIQLLNGINKVFSVDITMKNIFISPVLNDLAKYIESQSAAAVTTKYPCLPVDRSQPLPLTDMQQRLWIIDRLEDDSSHYNMPLVFRCNQAVDIKALNRALTEMVNRHEILRTRFALSQGESVQKVGPNISTFPLGIDDLRGHSTEYQEHVISQLFAQEAKTGFDLSEDLMIRSRIVIEHDQAYVLLVTLHHIAADGWSLEVLINELNIIYDAFLQGKSHGLAPLSLQYGDYAVWQRTWLSGDNIERLRLYWQQELHSLPMVHRLPLDYPRPPQQKFDGGLLVGKLPLKVFDKLTQLCHSQGVTPFMAIHAAFSTLIGRLSGENDIVVGTPIANREHLDVASNIGFFANTLVLRSDLSANPTYLELLSQSKQKALDAYEHQQMPFEQLVELINPERSLAYSPLFQIMLTYASGDSQQDSHPYFVPLDQSQTHHTSKFDLTLHFVEEQGGASLGWEYATALLTHDSVKRINEIFVTLVANLVQSPDQSIMSHEIVPNDDKALLEGKFNDTAKPYPDSETIHSMFEQQAERTPNRIALTFESNSLTYQELNHKANVLAARLHSANVGPDKLVGLCCYRSLEMVIALLAILKSGGAYVPLDPDYPTERLDMMLEDAQPQVILTSDATIGRVSADHLQINLDTFDFSHSDNHFPNPTSSGLTSNNLAYVIYTSGSTGKPKGVMNEHKALVNRILWMQQEFALDETDKVLQKTPFSFDVSVWEFFWPLMVGAELVVAKPEGHKDVDYLLNVIEQSQITTLHFVPPMLAMFMFDGRYQTQSANLRRIFTSGEALPSELAKEWTKNHHAQLHNLYGPTEAAIDVSWHACRADADYISVPIGKPINNIQLYVLNNELQIAPIGVAGELYIAGDGVARGYLNRPELTKERFIENPFSSQNDARLYKTGDLAKWNRQGELEYLGRLDHQVKIRGFRIELGEIDSQLQRHQNVSESITVDIEGANSWDKQLVSYVVPTESKFEEKKLTESLTKYLSCVLPAHMIPSQVIVLESLPLTPNGKVNRQALPQPNFRVETIEYSAPLSETESQLASIWSQVLQVKEDSISRTANFFDIGGQSLRAIQTLALVRKEFDVSFSVKQLFMTPILSDFATLISQTNSEQEKAAISPSQRSGLLPLTHMQHRLWFIDQMEGANAYYNICYTIEAKEKLEKNRLENALLNVVDRHEILRTSYLDHSDQTWQKVNPCPKSIGLGYSDLRHQDTESVKTKLKAIAQQEANTPFDLTRDTLLRGHLVEISEHKSVVILTMHHIASDGWSLGVLHSEIERCYVATDTKLPPLAIQYGDYANWQQQPAAKSQENKHLEYWSGQLKGIPLTHSLPLDQPRPKSQSYHGELAKFELESELSSSFRSLCKSQGVTTFMGLHAALSVLISRLSHQQDIVIATPVANREFSETLPLIGFFANTLPLRSQLIEGTTFIDVIQQSKRVTLEAYEHQQVPFEQIVDTLQPERSLSHHPIFQIMLSVTDYEQKGHETDLFRSIDLTDDESVVAKFDLTLHAIEKEGNIALAWEFCRDLFNKSTIEQFNRAFDTLLREMLASPRSNVYALPLISESERSALFGEYNQTQLELPDVGSYLSLFEQQVRLHPSQIAARFDDQCLSYEELNQASERLAKHIIAVGVLPKQLVGIYLDRCLDMLISMLAIGKAGCGYVPLDPRYPSDRIDYMLDDSKPSLILTVESLSEQLNTPVTKLCLDSVKYEIASTQTLPNVTRTDLAYVIYTSGSTGKPKGIAIEHGALLNFLSSMAVNPGLEKTDNLLAVTSMSFDIHTLELFLPLTLGAQVVIASTEATMDAEILANLIDYERITAMQATPATWQLLLNNGWQPDIKLKMLCGGEAMNAAVKAGLLVTDKHQLYDMYGPTETCVWSGVRRIRLSDGLGVIGGPIGNTQFYVLNHHLQPVPIGIGGELYIGGMGLAREYLNRLDLTEKAFIQLDIDGENRRLYKTGDQVRWLDKNSLCYMGRLDTQVKIRGFRVELGEIESQLLKSSWVSEAVTCVHSVTGTESALVSYVVIDDLNPSNVNTPWALIKQAIYRGLRADLPHYMVPSTIVAIKEMPLTPNGKVDRKSLLKTTLDIGQESYEQPIGEIELQLAEIWQQLVKPNTPISRNAQFFEIGGQSLLIVSMVNKVKAKFSINFSVKEVFSMPVLSDLAACIADKINKVQSCAGAQTIVSFSEGAENDIYCFPGLGGMSMAYAPLANALRGKLNVHAFDAPGMFGNSEPIDCFKEMVSHYVQEIRANHSHDSIVLVGHSFGGRVAFEVMRMLEAENSRVSLILLDTILTNQNFEEITEVPSEIEIKTSFLLGISNWLGIELPSSPEPNTFEFDIASEVVAKALSDRGFCQQGGFSIDGFWQVYRQQEIMNRAYSPSGRCTGSLHLLCCEETSPHMQEILAVNNLYSEQMIQSAQVAGEHNSMLDKNNAVGVADYLLSLIAASNQK
ncbi:hypothetical protein GCM10007938_07700 [Vibrio zhanjiangensis]|uniref:Amino acid adenylation domain-containing protein n=1 Tax=Vibrio zhanjiangensis TaxID=1046128 RepID=A0ABQ6EUZ3_9VIBR|nr:non-ribosomal peptide synthetase [Vibrio zhanjiangensis]GLT16993.1 hypothetical protein GCM10007938_07700 [Vibrio zhanjiangensis]